MAFFNEFPFTRCYDSDLAWLIRRMKEVLAKMDRVDEILATIEELLASLPETIRAEVERQLLEMAASGAFSEILSSLVVDCIKYGFYNQNDSLLSGIKNSDIYSGTNLTLENGDTEATLSIVNGNLLLGQGLVSNTGSYVSSVTFRANSDNYNPIIEVDFSAINQRLAPLGLAVNTLSKLGDSSNAATITCMCRNYASGDNIIFLLIWRNLGETKLRLNSNFDLSGRTSSYNIIKSGSNSLHFIDFKVPLKKIVTP